MEILTLPRHKPAEGRKGDQRCEEHARFNREVGSAPWRVGSEGICHMERSRGFKAVHAATVGNGEASGGIRETKADHPRRQAATVASQSNFPKAAARWRPKR